MITAVKAGYRLIDCANDYDNEHVIGEALQELFREGVVTREDLFIQVAWRLEAVIDIKITRAVND